MNKIRIFYCKHFEETLKDEVSVSGILVNYYLRRNVEISKSDCKL